MKINGDKVFEFFISPDQGLIPTTFVLLPLLLLAKEDIVLSQLGSIYLAAFQGLGVWLLCEAIGVAIAFGVAYVFLRKN